MALPISVINDVTNITLSLTSVEAAVIHVPDASRKGHTVRVCSRDAVLYIENSVPRFYGRFHSFVKLVAIDNSLHDTDT